MTDTKNALAQLESAVAAKKLSPGAVQNIRTWLSEPYLAEYAPQVAELLAAGKFPELDDAFWTIIPFGTGGRRGKMYPVGTSVINDRTIGESAQGLADYVKQVVGDKPLACAIAYDTRHRSRHFADLCSQIMAAAGFTVYFLDGYRSTPEISFAVRYKKCDCGIMITASHNPPSDNAVKVYWSTGGQLLPPHDEECIRRVQQVTRIERMPLDEALAAGKIVYCQEEVDPAFFQAVAAQSTPGPRDVKIIYSPLHGVGASAVCPVLERVGFRDVEVFGPHAAPDGDFPNVPNHIANPENAAVFDAIIERGKQIGADLILATDPDCDRLGCAAPLSRGLSQFGHQAPLGRHENGTGYPLGAFSSPWATLTGNQIGALLTDALLAARRQAGTLSPDLYVVKTLVTTELMRRIADDYGVQTAGNLLVGFKYIGGEMDRRGTKGFVLGAEESYGFLAGDHVRDKDAAVAAMLLAELAARLKAQGKTLHQRLDELFRQYGCHSESQISVQMPGERGMEDMKALMANLRAHPPQSLGGLAVARVRDYLDGTVTVPGGSPQPLDGPRGDLVFLDLAAEGNYVAVRPSGTEPKVKFYMFAYDGPAASRDLAATKTAQAARLKAMGADLRALGK
ncbi:MAG: phospho-sugar mutase [Thermoguttaceae bacterium]|jgi:phosphoglucomutase/phosphomannomutase